MSKATKIIHPEKGYTSSYDNKNNAASEKTSVLL